MLKKIENTRKKADMIVNARKQNEERQHKIEEERQRHEKEIHDRQLNILI